VFRARLQSYFRITIIRMRWSTLQQHKEATTLCEEGMNTVELNALLIPQSTNKKHKQKHKIIMGRLINIA